MHSQRLLLAAVNDSEHLFFVLRRYRSNPYERFRADGVKTHRMGIMQTCHNAHVAVPKQRVLGPAADGNLWPTLRSVDAMRVCAVRSHAVNDDIDRIGTADGGSNR